MRWVARLARSLGLGRWMDRRISEEMTFHLEMRTEENIARGMEPVAARRAALIAFGNRTGQAEATRDARLFGWLETTLRDLRIGARSLRRRPGLALTAILSLALGIGATTIVFSLLDAIAFKPLGYPGLERIVAIVETQDGESSSGNPLRNDDFAAQVEGFEAVAGYYGESAIRTGGAEPERVRLRLGTGDYFGVFGPVPSAGRAPTAAEQAGEPVLVVRERVAERWFGGASAAIGRSVVLDGVGYQIIGVADDRSEPTTVDGWAPAPRAVHATSRRAGFLFSAARLAPGVALSTAEAELAAVQRRLGREFPATDANREARLVPLQTVLVGEARSMGLVVLGIAGSVLLVACLNLASLLLGRSAERRRESAVRTALGAGTGSLVRLYLTESLLIASIGGAIGIALALAAVPVIRTLDLPIDLPRIAEAVVDVRVVGFALALVGLSTVAFGTVPALRAAQGSFGGRLGRSSPRNATRDLLVVAQAAIALVLLVTAGTLADGFFRLRRGPLGFTSTGVLTAAVDLSWSTPGPVLADFRRRAIETLEAIPGVRAVGVVDRFPFGGGAQSSELTVRGRTLPPELEGRSVSIRAIAGDYFGVLGIRLLQGSGLSGPRTVVVNEPFARLWLGEQPIGRELVTEDGQVFTVVGVIAGVRQSVGEDRLGPEIFIRAEDTFWPELAFVLATDQPVGAIGPLIRRRIEALGGNRMVEGLATMDDRLLGAARSPRLLTWLFLGFAGAAMGLVGIGLFGVLAGYVASRTSEIGVRIALGASPRAMMGEVTGRGVRLVMVGIGLGVIGSVALGGVLTRIPLGLRPNQPGLLIGSAVIFLGLAMATCLIPARRAARIDPALALRHD